MQAKETVPKNTITTSRDKSETRRPAQWRLKERALQTTVVSTTRIFHGNAQKIYSLLTLLITPQITLPILERSICKRNWSKLHKQMTFLSL